MIEQWTLLAKLTYVIYVYLCFHVVEINNLLLSDLYNIYVNLERPMIWYKQFRRCPNLELW
jgi:hypothetical protein